MTNRDVPALLDLIDPAWPLVQEWIATAQNPIEVLEPDYARRERTIFRLQVSTHSVLGGIAWETGGILIDYGWLRLLGSGHARLQGSLLTWNQTGVSTEIESLPNALIVAHDAIGGFFALNGGAFDGKQGNIFYLAPETLTWQDLSMSYSTLVPWALSGDLDGYYSGERWAGWELDVRAMTRDQGMSLYPPLWAAGLPVSQRSRRAIPMAEMWGLQRQLAAQIRDLPDGALVQLHVLDEGNS